jgi:YD repeat-containing protein
MPKFTFEALQKYQLINIFERSLSARDWIAYLRLLALLIFSVSHGVTLAGSADDVDTAPCFDGKVIEVIGNRILNPSTPRTQESINGFRSLGNFINGRIGSVNTVNGGMRLPIPESNSKRPSCADPSNPATNNPVIIATGEKILPQLDFDHDSLVSLSLVRTYRSSLYTSGSRLFGPRWMSSLDFPELQNSGSCQIDPLGEIGYTGCIPRDLRVTFPDGESRTYSRPPVGSSTAYFLKGVDPKLRTARGYAEIDDQVFRLYIGKKEYVYDSHSFRIIEILDNGRQLYSFNYTGELLQSVTNMGGQSVRFVWTADRVTSVIAPDGGSWLYQYDGQKRLVKVVPPGNTKGVIDYHYEDSLNPDLLTGQTVDGERQTRYQYYPNRKVLKSGTVNNDSFDTFSYPTDDLVDVSNERGETTRYQFQTAGTGKRLVAKSRAATQSTVATVETLAYDANGYLSSIVSPNGATAVFRNSATGKVLEMTYPSGTPEAITETNVWIVSWIGELLQEKVLKDAQGNAFLKFLYTYNSDDTVASETVVWN